MGRYLFQRRLNVLDCVVLCVSFNLLCDGHYLRAVGMFVGGIAASAICEDLWA